MGGMRTEKEKKDPIRDGRIEIVHMKVGSHLYGTNTPESDHDYATVFVPSRLEIILGRIPKVEEMGPVKTHEGMKTGPGEIESKHFSLHKFVRMACEGQTLALEMLHAPRGAIIEKPHAIWDGLVQRRKKFYSKNLNAFVGYARTQAAKYGIKGSRLNAVQDVLDFLYTCNMDDRLLMHWDQLPAGEHIRFHSQEANGSFMYEVCGKKVHDTAKVLYACEIFEKYRENYGVRATRAANNEGIDWKAVSHAVRVSLQVSEILTHQTMTLPSPHASLLMDIKKGKHDYTTVVAPLLESIMERNERLSAESTLPKHVDYESWDRWLYAIVDNAI